MARLAAPDQGLTLHTERSKVRSLVRPPCIACAIGLFTPVGVVKWLLQIDPEDAGILTVFPIPVWCVLVIFGLLIGRRLGMLS